MSGTGMEPDEERDLLAAEYVLGTLDPAMAEQVRHDATLAAAVAAWQERLVPLARLAAPIAPPPAVWNRIAASAGLRRAELLRSGSPWRAFWQNTTLWRWTTAASLSAAAALLVITLLRTPTAPGPAAALLPAGGSTAAFLAEEVPGGGLHLRAATPIAVAADKDLELWALPAGATRPVSLGIIPTGTRGFVVSHPAVPLALRTQLMVSLEPKGGSPTGQPTGPVLFAGTLID